MKSQPHRRCFVLAFVIAVGFATTASAADMNYLVAGRFPCALTRTGHLVCWFGGQVDVSGKFVSLVSDGGNNTLLLRADGSVLAVVNNDSGIGHLAALANSGLKFKSLALGDEARRACGVTVDGQLRCYGDDGAEPFLSVAIPGSVSGPNASAESFTQVSMGRFTTCALTTTGNIRCWGRTSNDITGPNTDPDTYTHVSRGDVTCALRTDERVKCWGLFAHIDQPHVSGPNASTDTFTSVGVGNLQVCGLKTDGHVQCWWHTGNPFSDFYGAGAQTNASTERFGAFSVGSTETHCGITLEGHARCFGFDHFKAVSTALTLTHNFTFSPPDLNLPVVTVAGANPLEVAYKGTFVDPGATASDLEDGDVTSQIVASGAVNVAVPGNYTRTYTVSDAAGNIGRATRTVTVLRDTNPPVITLLGADPLTIAAGSTFPSGTASALDAEDGDVTPRIVVSGYNAFQVGTQVVTYSVTDLSGNPAAVQRTIDVRDTTAPTLRKIPSSAVMTANSIGPGGTPVFWRVFATDNIDPAPVTSCTPPPNTRFPDGDTTVVCTATDASGNVATLSFRVHIRGAAEQLELLRAVVIAAGIDPGVTEDLLKKLDYAAKEIENHHPENAAKALEQFLRDAIAALIDGEQGVSASWAFTFVSRSNQIKRALGIAPLAGDVNSALVELLFLRGDMESFGIADIEKKLTHALEGAMIAVVDSKTDQAVHDLQKFLTEVVTVPMDPSIAEYFAGQVQFIESLLGFENSNPRASHVAQFLPYAIATVRDAGLDRGLTMDLLAKLAQFGKQLAKGTHDSCTPLLTVITTVEKEEASGRISEDQATWILGWPYYFRDVLGC